MNLVTLTIARLARFGIDADSARAVATDVGSKTVTIDIEGAAWRELLARARATRPKPAGTRPRGPTPAQIEARLQAEGYTKDDMNRFGCNC
jgi:hypothetical protein